jgi:hypothetical protein
MSGAAPGEDFASSAKGQGQGQGQEEVFRPDDSMSLFDPSVSIESVGGSEELIKLSAPSAQLSYQGRSSSLPAERVFKLDETNLLDYATSTSDRDLIALFGTNKQNSEVLLPKSPAELPLTTLGKTQKAITEPSVDNQMSRPDIKRSHKYTIQKDHEMMKTLSLTGLYAGDGTDRPVPEDPFDDPTGNLKNNTLLPKRIDKFPDEESQLSRAAHLRQLKTLRKYKHGLSPNKKLQMIDQHLQKQLPAHPLPAMPPSSGIAHQTSRDEALGFIEFNISVNPPSPMGRYDSGYTGTTVPPDDNSVQSHHSNEAAAHIVQQVLVSRRKEIVVKSIPEEKLGYYKRVTLDKDAPSSANSAAYSTAPSTAENSATTTRTLNSADTSANRLVSKMMNEMQTSAFEKELQGEAPSSPNNPLHRYRMEQQSAERVSTREPIRCCRCSKDSTFWCRQCCLSYCHSCWGLVPHHGFISTTGLPARPDTACEQDIPFAAFPALKKKYGESGMSSHEDDHSPVYSPTRSSLSRIGSTIRMLRQDKPFYKGLDMSDDAVDTIDLTLFGGLEGMKGHGPPRPTSGRGREPGEWRKPVGNPNKDRGMLAPKKKKKGKKGKKVAINIPSLSVSQNVSGRSTVSLGSQGAPPIHYYPMTGFTHDFFPEDWKATRPKSEITVYKGVPVYTTHPEKDEAKEQDKDKEEVGAGGASKKKKNAVKSV